MNTRNQHRRGIALIWTLVFAMVIIGFLGLAFDTGWMMLVHHQLQNAADASSLAGARLVRVQDGHVSARAAARDIALENLAGTQGAGLVGLQLDLNNPNAANGDIVIGRYNRNTNVFTVTTTSPNAVRVNARRTAGSLGGAQPLFFGPAYQQSTAQSARSATAVILGGLGAGLLILDPRPSPLGNGALTLQGGPDLAVIDGTIHVNSASSTAVSLGGNWSLTGEELNIVGSMSSPPTSLPVNTGVPPLPDPLSWLQPPDMAGMPDRGLVVDPGVVTLLPGHYPNGIRTNSNGNNITCEPGLYVIGTPGGSNQNGLHINGGTFTANECTFYVAAGGVTLNANSNITITPPPLDAGEYYEHISIFQSRTNNSDASIWAGNSSSIEGTLYFPGSPDATPPLGPQFDLNGGGFGAGVQVIAFRMRIGGNANLNIFFDGWWPGPLFTRVFLVQ